MKQFRKTALIEAVQLTDGNIKEIYTMVYGASPDLRRVVASDKWDEWCDIVRNEGMTIPTLEDGADGRAKHVATIGDWIIRGIQGEYYPCKPDIFAATYEAV